MLPLGFPMELSGPGDLDEKELIRNIDAAVGEVSTKFATQVCIKQRSPSLTILTTM
jgi:hypothetical protein